MIKSTSQFAEQVAQVLIEATLSKEANPLTDLTAEMSREEFNIFCKLVSFECERKIGRQVSIWQKEILENRVFRQ